MNGNPETHTLADDGTFPNNLHLPALVYRRILQPGGEDPASELEQLFGRHEWGSMWRNGIYTYQHYHSTAHEVLGVAVGSARVQLGGDQGPVVDLEAGDVVVIPAGVAHKNVRSSSDFLVVGAYPRGQDYDMNYGREGERPRADRNIEKTPLPETDPVFGRGGSLVELWNDRG